MTHADGYVLENIEGITNPKVLEKLQLWKPWPGHADGWPGWYRWDGGWYECEGEKTRYCVWDVGPESIVWDVGAYEGEWSRRMAERYDPHLYLFEPIPRARNLAQTRWGANPKMWFSHFALGAEERIVEFHDCDRDGAGMFSEGNPVLDVQMISFEQAMEKTGVEHIDLMSLNIEGGEYELLPHILDTGIIHRIDRMMIQWHWRQEGDDKRQRAIQERIAETHRMRWNHAAWEAWRKKTR
jgi:FkbM family methyltransferase